MSTDTLECFKSLLESVPMWTAKLSSIIENANRNQSLAAAELSRTGACSDRSSSSIQLQPTKKRRRGKSVSVCSNAPDDDTGVQLDVAVAEVIFDGEAQRGFEQLVRAIGVSRNMIRKGKLSAKLNCLSRSASSSSSDSAGEETIKGLGTFTYRTTTTLHRGGERGVEIFDTVDAALEEAQSRCEKAAHQLLRNGGCTSESSKAKVHLESAVNAVKAALPSMLKRAERERKSDLMDPFVRKTPSTRSQSTSIPSDGMLEVDAEEVDDSEGSDGDFNISSMMFLQTAKYRSTRANNLTATFAIH